MERRGGKDPTSSLCAAGGPSVGRYVTSLTDGAGKQGVSLLKLLFTFFMGIVITALGLPAEAATLREQQVLDLVVAQAALKHQVPRNEVVVEWQDRSIESMVPALPDGAVTLEIADSARLAGRGNVPVQILVNGRKFRTIFPRVDIKVYQKVLIAKRRLGRGETVSAADVSLERQAVSHTLGAPLTSLGALLGAEATREIPQGTALSAGMFKIPPVVKSGRMVSVVLTLKDLTIITQAEAKSDGAVGQIVKVLNLESKREFTARVTGPDRVEIKME